jgi:hypothetical protein
VCLVCLVVVCVCVHCGHEGTHGSSGSGKRVVHEEINCCRPSRRVSPMTIGQVIVLLDTTAFSRHRTQCYSSSGVVAHS